MKVKTEKQTVQFEKIIKGKKFRLHHYDRKWKARYRVEKRAEIVQ